ncbi:hypothetical protein [Terrimesophilobacter mesophilus]|nr:hypothetical protein [Terrimesophilobacter mesophilus]
MLLAGLRLEVEPRQVDRDGFLVIVCCIRDRQQRVDVAEVEVPEAGVGL